MAIADPNITTRAPQPVHEWVKLLALQADIAPATFHRDLLTEALAIEKLKATLKAVGFVEVMKRLCTPSYVVHGSDGSNPYDELLADKSTTKLDVSVTRG